MRRTKIVCTIGPACDSEPILRLLVREGMDVARLNFSHASHEWAGRLVPLIRRIAAEEGRVVALLQDLQGPRLRTGALAAGEATLVSGSRFTLTTRDVIGDASAVHIDFANLPLDLKPGDRVLLDNGNLELLVESTTPTDVITLIIVGGVLGEHKGMNFPGVALDIPTLADKDRADLRFGVQQGFDYVAMSFVRQADDLVLLKQLLYSAGSSAPVIAKIEKHEAVSNFEEILAVADGIMVARGDLGIETSVEEVPLLQKMIIASCRRAGKPVITATQMLESMMSSLRPTRAEASDIANAILDGTDAVMLSGETATGSYPVEAVRTMANVAAKAETAIPFDEHVDRARAEKARSITDAIGQATVEAAQELAAKAIIAATESGYTPRMIAKYRPSSPILAVTAVPAVLPRLALIWGVVPTASPRYRHTDEMIEGSVREAQSRGFVSDGDVVVVVAGAPIGVPGRTNLLRILVVGEG
ncbi:MAG: pyruvate kinase [Dehalococcoidia bacterium]|nr:pyruvate kinase [Dehalococcoidia bacterium]